VPCLPACRRLLTHGCGTLDLHCYARSSKRRQPEGPAFRNWTQHLGEAPYHAPLRASDVDGGSLGASPRRFLLRSSIGCDSKSGSNAGTATSSSRCWTCTHPAYAERYRRNKHRLGKQRGAKVAQIDIARKLTVAIWNMLTRNQSFAPRGAAYRLAA
jgi:hypothetical protein